MLQDQNIAYSYDEIVCTQRLFRLFVREYPCITLLFWGSLTIGLGQMQLPGLYIKEIKSNLSLSSPGLALAQQSMGSLGTSVETSIYSSPSAVGKFPLYDASF